MTYLKRKEENEDVLYAEVGGVCWWGLYCVVLCCVERKIEAGEVHDI